MRPSKHNANNFIMVPSVMFYLIQMTYYKHSLTFVIRCYAFIYLFIFCKVMSGGRCVGLTTLPPYVPTVLKSGSLNLLEPSGPVQACNGIAREGK